MMNIKIEAKRIFTKFRLSLQCPSQQSPIFQCLGDARHVSRGLAEIGKGEPLQVIKELLPRVVADALAL